MSDDPGRPSAATNGTEMPDIGVLALVRFAAELGMLAALGYGGWHLVERFAVSVVLAAALPLVAAMVWGRWIAPRANHRLHDPMRLIVEVVLFAAAAALLIAAGPNPLALVLATGLALMFLVSLPHRRTELVDPAARR